MIDKVTFALKEMLLTRNLLEIECSGFYHRALARKIIIRLPDFITFCRRLNNETFQGAVKEHIRGELNALHSLYEQYLMEIRHSYGGHFKEQDFADRIAVWSEIDLVKVEFFTDEALKIYSSFKDIPGYINFSNIAHLLDVTDEVRIQELFKSQLLEKQPMFSSDILSHTRFNSGGIIPMNELQDRIATMHSLTIVLDFEFELLEEITEWDLVRLIKSLILVDIVSFLDNFITRCLPERASQEMDGLDKIVIRYNLESPKFIFSRIKRFTRVVERVEQIRKVRNKVGAHIDSSDPLTTSLLRLDRTTNDEARSLYEYMKTLFQNIYNSDRTLQVISLPPTLLHGVIEVGNQPLQPFKEGQISHTKFSPMEYSEENFRKVWDNYLNSVNMGQAVRFFWDAVYGSEEREVVKLEERFGPYSVRYHYLKLNEAHLFFKKLLDEHKFESDNMKRLIQLLVKIKDPSVPFLLCEIYPSINNIPEIEELVAAALGETSEVKDQQSIAILMERFISTNVQYLNTSLLALLKIDIRTTGLQVLNKNGKAEETEISSFILNKIETLPPLQRVILTANLLSELYFNRELGGFSCYWAAIYEQPFRKSFDSSLQKQLVEWQACSKGRDEQAFQEIMQSFNLNHFGWAVKLIGDLIHDQQPEQAQTFYHLAAYQIRISSVNKTLLIQRACTLFIIEDYEEALSIAEDLCRNEAYNLDHRMFYLDIAAEAKYKRKFENMVQKTLSELTLSSDQLKILEQLEQSLNC
ncbi:hypothetical protein [Priestia megaterium]|uniref:hypothetical protein n=1 Tax=Priestia megaterium TaxID=1404 RepID=UPI000EF9DDED|nr:hypothetical protein [Priestia megaterium]RMA90900.1 hypothetical protein DEU44_2987 [Priestia megaterium]